MEVEFDSYKERRIDFLGVQMVGEWNVKLYTITLHERFQSHDTLGLVRECMGTEFVPYASRSTLITHRHAFLIAHEAREGVWLLFSWWTGGEMLETIVRFASYKDPLVICPSPYSGSLVCTWELEVYLHERAAWIRHVLKQSLSPDFISYQSDGLNGK